MENERQFEERITHAMLSEQRALNALFRVVEMCGEEGKTRADMLASIILSQKMHTLSNHEDMIFADMVTQRLQKELLDSLQRPVPHDKDTHEELIHAYVSLSKALEYQRFMSQLK